ncbi:MAG: lytic transglycosylase domain-containing protein [Thermodesulfobacteriota bacterium]|nr:lytic transglycosylase domain-containing protein [Thermodesulfobacteriota bacterium]
MNKDVILHMFSTVSFCLFVIAVFISGTSICMHHETQNDAGASIKEPFPCKVGIPSPLPEKVSPSVFEIQDQKAATNLPLEATEEDSSSFCRGEECEPLFQPIIHKACNRYKVDPALVKAVIMAESSYNPRAVSKKGAKGLMQLMPETADSLGVNDMFDPEQNINGGVKYLKQLLDKYDGDVHLALAAYNAGSKKVRKYRGVPPFKATRYYIKKIYRYYGYYKKDMMSKTDSA